MASCADLSRILTRSIRLNFSSSHTIHFRKKLSTHKWCMANENKFLNFNFLKENLWCNLWLTWTMATSGLIMPLWNKSGISWRNIGVASALPSATAFLTLAAMKNEFDLNIPEWQNVQVSNHIVNNQFITKYYLQI